MRPIERLRRHLKMTQAAFGESIGHNQTRISALERGVENPSRDFVLRLEGRYGRVLRGLRISTVALLENAPGREVRAA